MEGGASLKRSGTADEAVDAAGGLAEEKALQSPNSPLPVDTDPESTGFVSYPSKYRKCNSVNKHDILCG